MLGPKKRAHHRAPSSVVAGITMDKFMMGSNSRIVWDMEEKRKIAAHVGEARMHNPVASIVTLVNNAVQAVLEVGRQREIRGLSMITWLSPLVREYLAEAYPSPVDLREQLAQANCTIDVLNAKVAELQALLLAPPDLSKTPTADLHSAYVGRIKQEAVQAAKLSKDEIVAEVLTALKTNVQMQPIVATSHGAHSPVNVNVTIAPQAPRRLKIVIVGGKAEALKTIAAGVKASGIDATFVHKHMDDPSLRSGTTLPAADYYLVIGGTVRKQIRDKVLAVGGTEKVVMSKTTGSEQGLVALM